MCWTSQSAVLEAWIFKCAEHWQLQPKSVGAFKVQLNAKFSKKSVQRLAVKLEQRCYLAYRGAVNVHGRLRSYTEKAL